MPALNIIILKSSQSLDGFNLRLGERWFLGFRCLRSPVVVWSFLGIFTVVFHGVIVSEPGRGSNGAAPSLTLALDQPSALASRPMPSRILPSSAVANDRRSVLRSGLAQ